MVRLLHHKLDPSSRLIRLMCEEYAVPLDLNEISPWKREPKFLEISPAGTLPILMADNMPPIVGVLACLHAVEEQFAPDAVQSLMPVSAVARSENWRLIEWVLVKLNDEVTQYVLGEKVGKRDIPGQTPDTNVLRAAKTNLSEHMNYFNWLLASRSWLAGEEMSLADFALAAHLSSLDYLGDISWSDAGDVKDWYSRMKSRPSFRSLLADRVVGTPASKTYANLDF